MAIIEKIQAIEDEMRKTQKNKATEYHLGLLKAKLAKLRAQLLEPAKKGPVGEGFDVSKSGDARVALLGFPSTGKSTLLGKTTSTVSATAAYEYTTLTAIPGVIEYMGARIQLLDLPGIIEGASQGRGRGRQVVSVVKTADLILMMLDCTKAQDQKRLLEIELDAVGVRINQTKPDVILKKRLGGGGITVNSTVPLTKISQQEIRSILAESKLHNMDVMIREDIDVDQFIDVMLGNRRYVPCLYCYNKIDGVSMEMVEQLARQPHSIVISCALDLNIKGPGGLIETIWEELGLLRIYTKKRGNKPDFSDPLIVRRGATVEDVAHAVHRSLVDHFAYCLVWGKSSRFNPQPYKCGLTHKLADQDIISLATK